MNTDDPRDIAPLSYGCGLALGLMLILGLPTERRLNTPSTTKPQAGVEPVASPELALGRCRMRIADSR